MVIYGKGHYFIEPLSGHSRKPGDPHPHVVYKAAHLDQDDVHIEKKPTDTHCSSAMEETTKGRLFI